MADAMRFWEKPKMELVDELKRDEEGNITARVRTRLFTRKGKICNYVVQFEHAVDGDWKEVVRFNYSHGFVHKDIYDINGRQVRKIDMGTFHDLKDAVDMALTDISQKHEAYIKRFMGK
jgi:hypothetical protein